MEREISIKSRVDSFDIRGVFWSLLKFPYCMVDAGRQRMFNIGGQMTKDYGLERVFVWYKCSLEVKETA